MGIQFRTSQGRGAFGGVVVSLPESFLVFPRPIPATPSFSVLSEACLNVLLLIPLKVSLSLYWAVTRPTSPSWNFPLGRKLWSFGVLER